MSDFETRERRSRGLLAIRAAWPLVALLVLGCAQKGVPSPSPSPGRSAPASPSPAPAPLPTSPSRPAPSGTSSGTGDGQLPYTLAPRQTEAQRSAAERQLQEDTKNFRNVVFGGFLATALEKGPLLLAKCWAAFPRDKQSRERCMGAAVVVVTIEGVSKGYAQAVAQKAGNDRLRAMQQVTRDMEADNARIQQIIDASDAVVAEAQGRLRKLQDDVRQKRVAAEQARAEAKRDQENLDTMQTALKDARATRDEYQKASANFRGTPPERSKLDAQIAAMTKKVAELEANVKKLSAALVPFTA
ncbi:MAG: hypothetical protein HY855_17670 [Burkholderiales bacterium]|nr:hypothetical protein [Burkholderiales bacterium]